MDKVVGKLTNVFHSPLDQSNRIFFFVFYCISNQTVLFILSFPLPTGDYFLLTIRV